MKNGDVFREVIKINHQWNDILREDVRHINLFCWKANKMELKFVDAFVKYKLSETETSKDIFLLFINPFEELRTFGHSIISDEEIVLNAWYDSLNEKQQSKKNRWTQTNKTNSKENLTDAYFFVQNINTLHSYYELSHDQKIFIVISPSSVHDIYEFNLWLSYLIKYEIHPCIKFIIYDDIENPLYKKVTSADNTRIIKPNIDVLKAVAGTQIRDVDSKEPAIIFQQKLIEASKLLGKQNKDKAIKKTEECLSIAKVHKLPDLLVSAYMFRANLFMIFKDKKQALKEITLAVEKSEHNDTLKLQALFFKGGLLFRYSKEKEAYQVYKQSVPLADKINDDFLRIESRRLYGFFAEKSNKSNEAWEVYLEALNIVKEMDSEQVMDSTFGLLGKKMLSLSISYDYNYRKLYNEIEALLGKDWLKKLQGIREAKKGTILGTID